jgi:hypothetical protein
MPWEERDQKNIYLAGHRVGNLDRTGQMIFFNVDKLERGRVGSRLTEFPPSASTPY